MLSTLNQRAALLACTNTPDGGGGFSASWNIFATIWVALAPLSARDSFDAGGIEMRVRHRITLRRRADVAAGQHLAIGPRLFHVHGILDEGPRAAFMTLQCEELP